MDSPDSPEYIRNSERNLILAEITSLVSMTKNYKFLDAKIKLKEDELRFEKGLLQKLNQLSRRMSTPESVELENISSCFVRDEGNAAHKPELVIKHSGGSEEIKCNKGIAHKFTSIFGYDGVKGAEEIAKRFDDENQEDKLMKDL